MILRSRERGRTYGSEIGVLQAQDRRVLVVVDRRQSTFHIDYNNKLDTSVGEPSVHGEALINGLQESKVLANIFLGQTSIKNVKTCRKHKRKVEFAPLLFIAVCGEDGDVEGIVLWRELDKWWR